MAKVSLLQVVENPGIILAAVALWGQTKQSINPHAKEKKKSYKKKKKQKKQKTKNKKKKKGKAERETEQEK